MHTDFADDAVVASMEPQYLASRIQGRVLNFQVVLPIFSRPTDIDLHVCYLTCAQWMPGTIMDKQ